MPDLAPHQLSALNDFLEAREIADQARMHTATRPFFEHLTFKGNLKATRYGWLRLTPAYSVHLVAEILEGALVDGAPLGGRMAFVVGSSVEVRRHAG